MERADALGELLLAPVDADLDVEVATEQLDAGLADLLLDEHAQPLRRGGVAGGARDGGFGGHHAPSLSTIQSTHAVSACTSASSTAGNMPMRSWFRPSLR